MRPCLPFVRDSDMALLGWDMMDASPNEYDIGWSVHGVIFAYGVALLGTTRCWSRSPTPAPKRGATSS